MTSGLSARRRRQATLALLRALPDWPLAITDRMSTSINRLLTSFADEAPRLFCRPLWAGSENHRLGAHPAAGARRWLRMAGTPTILIPPWDTPADAGRAGWITACRSSTSHDGGGVPRLSTYRLLREISAIDLEPSCISSSRAPMPVWCSGGCSGSAAGGRRRARSCSTSTTGSRPGRRSIAIRGRWPAFWPGRKNGASATHTASPPPAAGWSSAPAAMRRRRRSSICPTASTPPTADAPALDANARQADVLFFSRFVEVSPAWLGEFAGKHAIRNSPSRPG